ncbi:MAG: tetratricopeptide repeat protein [Myxococcales bacterium]
MTSTPSSACGASSSWFGRGCAFVAVLVLGASVSAAGEERCSLAAGETWREYQSAHFVIDAAGSERDAGRLVAAFEDLHAAVLATLVSEPVDIPGRVRVVVLPHQRDLVDYSGSRSVAGIFWVSPLAEPTILISGDSVETVPQIVAHELTHLVSSYMFPRQPYWFAEGLAQFVEGVAKIEDGRRWAGADPANGWIAGSVKLAPMASLLSGWLGGGWGVDPYLTSWVLYRFLWNERGKQLTAYQRHLMDGKSPSEAWRLAFPEWEIANGKVNALDYLLSQHQLTGRGVRWEIKVGNVDRTFTSRPAALGDVHLALLGLRLFQTNTLVQTRVRRQALEEALREQPRHPVLNAELARLREVPLLPALRAGAEAQPNDGRGWYLLGVEASDPAERETALRRAVEHWPDGALAQAALATHLARTGRAKEALPLANRAADLAPWQPMTFAALATVAVELGNCKQAIALQTSAVEIVDSKRVGSLGVDAKQMKDQLTEMQKRCASPRDTVADQ